MSILNDLVTAGAAGGAQYGMRIDEHEPGVGDLIGQGYVVLMDLLGRTDHDHYTLTRKGREIVHHCIRLQNPEPLLQTQRSGLGTEIGFDKQTAAELILHLGSTGWTDEECKKTKKSKPYDTKDPNSPKVWYRTEGIRISRLYLQCLARASDLCCPLIHHFQSQAYYKSLLSGCDDVKPFQPLVYYKLLMKKKLGCQASDEDEYDNEDEEVTHTDLQPALVFDEPCSLRLALVSYIFDFDNFVYVF